MSTCCSYTMHHIVSDGWSMGILIREVETLYQAYSAGRSLAAAGVGDPVRRFRGLAENGCKAPRSRRNWSIGGSNWLEWKNWSCRQIIRDRRRELSGGEIGILVESGEMAERLRALSRREGVTLFMTLLGGFDVLMSRYSGQEDVALGTDIANRNRAEIEGLIGFFVNQLVLRVEVRT